MKFFETLGAVCGEMGVSSSDVHPELPRASEYRTLGLGGGAVTIEEGMFLCGLLWVERPDVVIELGTSRGASAVAMGAALKDLGHGKLLTIDMAKREPAMASKLVSEYDLPIEFICETQALDFLKNFDIKEGEKYFVFSDTEISERPDEVTFILNKFPEGTLIVVHDTSDFHPLGPMRLKARIPLGHCVVDFPSPRGISLLRA